MVTFYDWIGANRPRLARLTAFLLPWRSSPPLNAPARIFCVFLAALALTSNIVQIPRPYFLTEHQLDLSWEETKSAQNMIDLARLFQVNQQWSLFAPNPFDQQVRILAVAHLADGSVADYTQGLPNHSYWLDENQYPHISEYWTRSFLRLAIKRYKTQRAAFANYLCRTIDVGQPPEKIATALDLKFYLLPVNFIWPGPADQPPVPDTDESYSCPARP